MTFRLLRDQWFLVGVLLVTALTLVNPVGMALPVGNWLATHKGNEICLMLIFILSGLDLDGSQIMQALVDWQGVLIALASVFVLSPLLAWGFAQIAPSPDVALGLFLVGVVSTTQASGIVMAAAAGGRAAHALFITIMGNVVCIATIPLTLAWLVGTQGSQVSLPWQSMMGKLALLILLPLCVGMALRRPLAGTLARLPFKPSQLNRLLILVILFIGLSQGRANILGEGRLVMAALGLTIALHLVKAGLLWTALKGLGYGPGRRESVFFMGIQKTLPQAIWLQAAYFPTQGMALVVCVLYHISQLIIDSGFVGRLGSGTKTTPGKSVSTEPGQ